MIVEVDVRIEVLPRQIFVRSAADVFRVVEQFRNPGDAAHEFEKRRIAHQLIEAFVRRAEGRQFGEYGLAADFAMLVDGAGFVEDGELGHQFAEKLVIQEMIDHDILEGLRRLKLSAQAIAASSWTSASEAASE